jgi:putative ABC transport system ATP-binding protein
MVGLGNRMNHMPSEMSGGEQQRVAIARALAHRPKVIFADEPTAELDSLTGLQVVKIFQEMREHTTMVIATHDEAVAAAADQVYEIEDGVLK